ncbi:Lrp/AsnC ligand binding domain-containing protein [Candidatus Bathyarchaeota archaeon]|nr:Lrp/AsnC ligand binding domain-containing protein [Candidatus Bathyarchaeota archaeon]
MDLAKNKEVESVDVISGDWDLIIKVRTKDQDEYYDFMRTAFSKKTGIQKTISLISLKQIKTEFVLL